MKGHIFSLQNLFLNNLRGCFLLQTVKSAAAAGNPHLTGHLSKHGCDVGSVQGKLQIPGCSLYATCVVWGSLFPSCPKCSSIKVISRGGSSWKYLSTGHLCIGADSQPNEFTSLFIALFRTVRQFSSLAFQPIGLYNSYGCYRDRFLLLSTKSVNSSENSANGTV